MRDTTNSGAYQKWKLLVVERAEVFARRDHGRESFPSVHVRTPGMRERRKDRGRNREGEREKKKKKKKKKREDELKGRGGEGAKLTRGGELSGREERKREDERASSISPTW